MFPVNDLHYLNARIRVIEYSILICMESISIKGET